MKSDQVKKNRYYSILSVEYQLTSKVTGRPGESLLRIKYNAAINNLVVIHPFRLPKYTPKTYPLGGNILTGCLYGMTFPAVEIW